MSVSILSRQDRLTLGNGMVLRLISADELLCARREARELAQSPLEQPLCSNACLVARALILEEGHAPFFLNGKQVLEVLTAEEIEALACRWDKFRRAAQPVQEEGVERGFNPNFDEKRVIRREESQR